MSVMKNSIFADGQCTKNSCERLTFYNQLSAALTVDICNCNRAHDIRWRIYILDYEGFIWLAELLLNRFVFIL